MDVDGWVDEDEEDANEDILHALRDFMGDSWRHARAQGARTWRQRLEKVDARWSSMMDQITDAYLHWRYPPLRSPPSANPPKCPVGVRTSRAAPTSPSGTAAPPFGSGGDDNASPSNAQSHEDAVMPPPGSSC
ncbi:hypothetical protein OH77DRAFT_1525240 [Trametes cingulata]|nr:hypothetical protein OH77DRAFT_1525240 [Trametes cingulata]